MRRNILDIIVGPAGEFKVENRIFNLICALGVVLDVIGYVLNALLYRENDNYSFVVAAVLTARIYYLGRFKKLYTVAIPWMIFLSYGVVSATYIFNNGSEGAILLTAGMVFVFLIAVTPQRFVPFILVLHLLIFLTLGGIEYWRPEWIQDNHASPSARLIDIISVFVVTTLVLAITLGFLRKALDSQRREIQRKNSKLEESQEHLKRVFSVLSHDLRNPLINVQSYLEILEDASLTNEQRKRFKSELLASVKSSNAMLEQTLQWSKVQIEGQEREQEIAEVSDIMQSAVGQVTDLATKKGVNINFEQCGCLVKCNPDQLIIILRNLLHNAIKYSDPGQTVKLYSKTSDDTCRIIVEDNGKGMDQAQLKRLFTKETRSSRGTENERGAGIGLLLCKQLAELNNARLEVESELGRGSKFIVALSDAEIIACESSNSSVKRLTLSEVEKEG